VRHAHNGIPGEEKPNEIKEIFKITMAETFPKLMTDTKIQKKNEESS
jgi:hypothetical protein